MTQEDKEVLIIDPEELELELCSDSSPYCTTTVQNFRGGGGPHKKIYIPSTGSNRPSSGRLKFWKNPPEFSQRISTISFTTKQPQQSRKYGRFARRLRNCAKICSEIWCCHWRMVLSSSLTVISAAATLISFPLHLEQLRNDNSENGGGGGGPEESSSESVTMIMTDGFSACFAISTILVLLFLLTSLGVKLVYWGSGGGGELGGEDDEEMRVVTVIKPCISWKTILKIGFSVGLSVLSLCSAWEDNKVVCNLQDSLLGIVIIFAIITYCISKWRHFGLKRAFALMAVAAGVFVSVIYMLVDHHRCRGVYHAFPPKDIWSWKVHFVWTLAFVIAIWLWTVAMFCLESALPLPPKTCRNGGEEYNAVKMKVLRVKTSANGTGRPMTPQQTVIESLTCSGATVAERPGLPVVADRPSAVYRKRTKYFDPYTNVSYVYVFNAVLWFHITSWAFIASLFWTEFIPGFGIGKNGDSAPHFLSVVWSSFDKCFHDGCSWWLITALFVYSQSFTYVILLTQSSMMAICITCFGFPVIGVWWSIFQVNPHNMFVWMPVYTGELICSLLGFPLILAGTLYLFKLDVLNRNKRLSSTTQGCY